MSPKTSLEKQYNKMADFDYSKKFDKNRFSKYWARKWGFTSNGGDTTDPNEELNTLRSIGVVSSYSASDIDALNQDLSNIRKYQAEAETKLSEERLNLELYVKVKPIYDKFTAAPYWGSPNEDDFAAYANENADFGNGEDVEEAFETDDISTEFRASLDAYVKAAAEKAKGDLIQKAINLVDAQTWTVSTTNADIKAWYEAENDAYVKAAFPQLTDAQLLEIKTDADAAKLTVGEKPVEQFLKLTATFTAEAAEIGEGGNLAESVKEWVKAKSEQDQVEWEKIKGEHSKSLAKASNELSNSADAYVKVKPGTQFDTAQIEKAIPLLQARIAQSQANAEAIEAHKSDTIKEKEDHLSRKEEVSPRPDALNNGLDFPSARQTYQATLNKSFERIKNAILEAVAKNAYECKVHMLFEHEFEVLTHLGYEIIQYKDKSNKDLAEKQIKSGKDLDPVGNFYIRWRNLEIAERDDRENTWFKTFEQKNEA